jgi:uncharacterized glyoxalase superfamily protein PhnB
MPSCPVLPILVYDDVEGAVEWLCRTFNFGVRWQVGSHRAQLRVGDAAVVVRDRPQGSAAASRPPGAGERSSVMIRVEDVDAHHRHAADAGAEVLDAPSSHRYGERQYSVRDPAGHLWCFSQSIADVAPEEWGGVSGAATQA